MLSFDSAGSYAGKCEQDVNRKKIVVTTVTLRYVKSQSADLVGTRKIVDLESSASTPPLICSFHVILYTCKVFNAKSDAFALRNKWGDRSQFLIVEVFSTSLWIRRAMNSVLEFGFAVLNPTYEL